MDKRSIRKKLETGEVERIIARYLAAVGEDVEISDAFLFGSYARGKAKAEEDRKRLFFTNSSQKCLNILGIHLRYRTQVLLLWTL